MKQMIQELIASGYLKTPAIIEAFQKIDRRDFVPDELKEQAYLNVPLPIGYGQTISQPLTVAFMLELLEPKKGDRILEIGSGSGWQTALLSHIVGEGGKVFAIEVIPELMAFGKKNVSKYNFFKSGVAEFHHFNAIGGMPEKAPFDKIISAASGAEVPAAWKEQLKTGGRIVAPVKESIRLMVKREDSPAGKFEEKNYPGFVFVPLVNG
ncbi:MAG: protein-L-isoaspartate O-methyltransferase [Patescibacteria group bacterium]